MHCGCGATKAPRHEEEGMGKTGTDDRWTVHGFINGGQEQVERAAFEVAQMFDAVGIRTELAYLPESCSDDDAPHHK